MSEKEYYNELVLEAYYSKLFDEEIEKKLVKPLKASIINSFTGFSGGCFFGSLFEDDNGKKVKVIIEVSGSDGVTSSLLEENNMLKQVSQDYEDNVSNWFIENWNMLSDEQKQSAHLELGIDIEYDGDDV